MDRKYNELLKYSNPRVVFKKAKQYLGDDVNIQVSTRKDKKYMVYNPTTNTWVHFGSFNPPMEDFTRHKNLSRRDNYLARSNAIKGNWRKNKYSPNNLSIHILW